MSIKVPFRSRLTAIDQSSDLIMTFQPSDLPPSRLFTHGRSSHTQALSPPHIPTFAQSESSESEEELKSESVSSLVPSSESVSDSRSGAKVDPYPFKLDHLSWMAEILSSVLRSSLTVSDGRRRKGACVHGVSECQGEDGQGRGPAEIQDTYYNP